MPLYHYSIFKEHSLARLGGVRCFACALEQLGGDERARTANLRLAKPALSQLSYVPGSSHGGPNWTRTSDLVLIRDAL